MQDSSTKRKQNRNLGKIDAAMFLVLLAIVGVVAVPRYDRFSKTAEAKSSIQVLNEATRAVIEEARGQARSHGEPATLPHDDALILALTERLGGSIPENPFTKNNTITLLHERAFGPCDTLEAQGGWVWNLVSTQADDRPVISRVWLNSDTVHISAGKGEGCIQP